MIQKRAVNMGAVRKHLEVSDIRMKDTSVAGTPKRKPGSLHSKAKPPNLDEPFVNWSASD